MADPGAVLFFNSPTMHLFTLHKGSVMSLKFLKVIVNGINFFLVPTVSFLARKSAGAGGGGSRQVRQIPCDQFSCNNLFSPPGPSYT